MFREDIIGPLEDFIRLMEGLAYLDHTLSLKHRSNVRNYRDVIGYEARLSLLSYMGDYSDSLEAPSLAAAANRLLSLHPPFPHPPYPHCFKPQKR